MPLRQTTNVLRETCRRVTKSGKNARRSASFETFDQLDELLVALGEVLSSPLGVVGRSVARHRISPLSLP